MDEIFTGSQVEVLQFMKRNDDIITVSGRSSKDGVHAVTYRQIKTHYFTKGSINSPTVRHKIELR